MTSIERFYTGAVGGLLPSLAELAAWMRGTDDEWIIIRESFTNLAHAIDTFLLPIVLMIIGGVVAWLFNREDDRIKLCIIGIAAPALVSGWVASANLVEARKEGPNPLPIVQKELKNTDSNSSGSESRLESMFRKVNSVPIRYDNPWATPATQGNLRNFSLPKEGIGELLLRSLTKSTPKKRYFVVAGAYPTSGEASLRAEAINKNEKMQGVKAHVYKPYGKSRDYSVVLGESNIGIDDAKQIQRIAIAAGLRPTPRIAYLGP